MSVWRLVLGLAVGWFCSASPARAILIETNDGKAPVEVGGFVVKDDGITLTVRVRTPDGLEKDTAYLHEKIKVLHRLDVKRLEALSRDKPEAYRDYAEELARQKKDPEARDTALRLYLITAYLKPDQFGSSSLIRMSEMASTQAEARRYRALAYVLDPKAGADLLKVEVAKPAPPDKTQATALEHFIKALQYYRAGRITEAISAAKKEGVDKIFSRTPFKVDQKTFLQWCADANCGNCKMGRVFCPLCKGQGVVAGMFGQAELCGMCKGTRGVNCPDCGGWRVLDRLPVDAMTAILKCELWALEQQSGAEDADRKEANEAKGWSAVLQASRPIARLSPETISDFDPRKCRYRNGKWVDDSAP